MIWSSEAVVQSQTLFENPAAVPASVGSLHKMMPQVKKKLLIFTRCSTKLIVLTSYLDINVIRDEFYNEAGAFGAVWGYLLVFLATFCDAKLDVALNFQILPFKWAYRWALALPNHK